jgi:hypothetical protein
MPAALKWYDASVTRLRRIIFNGLVVMSLLLFLGTVALWLRSYRADDIIGRMHRDGWSVALESSRGRFWCCYRGAYVYCIHTAKSHNGWWRDTGKPIDGLSDTHLLGYYVLFDHGGFILDGVENDVLQSKAVTAHIWFISLAASVLPARWALRYLRVASRSRHGCCTKCGYDLRATPDRCPECGSVPVAAGR